MHCHVTITRFKTDAQSPFSVLCHVFTHPTRKVSVVTRLLASRAYGVKKPTSPSDFKLPQKCHIEHAWVRTRLNAGKGERVQDAGASSSPREDRSSRHLNYRVNKDSSLGLTTPPPPSHVTTPAIPSSKWDLYQELLRLISLNPPAPFSRLISVHRRQPTLQSVESYNLLLQLSIRHSWSRHTQSLISSMALNRIEPNYNTEKLVVRHLVMGGHWKQAWQQTLTRHSAVARIPMPVLLELLAPGTRNSPRSKRSRSRRLSQLGVELPVHSTSLNRPGANNEDGETAPPLDTLILILHRFPQLPVDELARLPPRVISYVVRGLIRNGHEEEAVVLTEKHLKGLPHEIRPRRMDFARDLVHLHLSSGKVKLATYKKKRRLVERLFSLHPNLRPNSNTVFLLMRYLKGSKRCGIEAYLFYKDYRSRWGAAVESLDVRRRIISYAIKQRKYGIAKEISSEGPLEDPSPSHRQAVRGGSDPLFRVRRWRAMYPRDGRASRFWRRIVIRVLGRRRARKRQRANKSRLR